MGRIKKSDLNSPWAIRKSNPKRTQLNLEFINSFYIYCEGENTEPEYFKSFPVNPQTTKVFAQGYGRQRTSLVNHVIAELKALYFLKGQKHHDSNRQLWVVFDYDYKGQEQECNDFNDAIQKANSKGINVAYSNDSFELWFVLHFQQLEAEKHRKDLYQLLQKHLGFDYKNLGKSKIETKKMFLQLREKQETAIKNAENLWEKQKLVDLCNQNPVTKVHLLVQELNKFIRK